MKTKKENKIVLINPVNPDPPPNYFGPPYGISLIGANLIAHKRRVAAYDFDLKTMPEMLSAVPRILCEHKPRYIGINIQSCTRGPVYELIKAIRKIDKAAAIILGGPFASIKYELLLKNLPVEFVVIGDGEQTLVELLDCLDDQGDLKQINGIAFIKDGRLHITGEREKVVNLDKLPYPAFELFEGFDRRINAADKEDIPKPNFILGRRCTTLKNALLLLSSRGCIYSCNFCPMSTVKRNKVRFHSPAYFIDMVEYFYNKHGIRNYVFGDNTFTLIRNRVMDICDGILRKGLRIKWSCMTRADYVDLEMLKTMARAGCFEISYGIESGSPKIQKEIGKNLDLAKAKECFALTKKAGMRSILMLMVGNTCDTEQTIRETAHYVRDIEPDTVLVKTVKVYPGTKIHDIFEKNGLISDDYYLKSDYRPPSFTVGHTARQLEGWSQMIKTRLTVIHVNNKCNNSCIYCRLPKNRGDKGIKDIKEELLLASTIGEHALITGGEPLIRKDFFDIANFADKAGIHHLYLYSNARMLYYEGLVRDMLRINSLRKVIVPFWGGELLHDEISMVNGAFSQAISGIENLKRIAGHVSVAASITVIKKNRKLLSGLVSLLHEKGVDEFNFIYLKSLNNCVKVPDEDLPVMSDIVSEFEKIKDFLAPFKKQLYFEGLPMCILKGFKANLTEPYHPFDKVIPYNNKEIVSCIKARESDKQKFKFCAACKEMPWCEGVWKVYAKKHGNSEFRPC